VLVIVELLHNSHLGDRNMEIVERWLFWGRRSVN